jgi:hypothetical protein
MRLRAQRTHFFRQRRSAMRAMTFRATQRFDAAESTENTPRAMHIIPTSALRSAFAVTMA